MGSKDIFLNNEKNSIIEVCLCDGIVLDKDKLIEEYVATYQEIVEKYKDYVVHGTGYKTNAYHSAEMNMAYNFIKHPDFERIAKEPAKGYTKFGGVRSKPISYKYYLAIWSVVCDKLKAKHGNEFFVKFDHRHVDRKNNDFDGFLFCYKNKKSWHKRNLPNNQRYAK